MATFRTGRACACAHVLGLKPLVASATYVRISFRIRRIGRYALIRDGFAQQEFCPNYRFLVNIWLMKNLYRFIFAIGLLTVLTNSFALPPCQGSDASKWNNCYGSWTAPSGYKYVGEWKNGKRNGYFTATYTNGDTYVGEFKDDVFNGRGTYTSASGNKYVGEYKNDKRNGPGTYYFLADNQWKGDKYVGEFKDGFFSGQGTYTFADGTTQTGEWKDDKQNGQGVTTFADGRRYVGEYKDHKFSGRGIFYLSNGIISQSGIWNDDKLITSQYVDPNSFTRIAKSNSDPSGAEAQRLENERKAAQLEEERRKFEEEKRQAALERQRTESQKGQRLPPCQGSDVSKWNNCYGSWTASDGNQYVGEWESGTFNGQGTYIWTDGAKHVGELREGYRNGQGTAIYSSGDKYVGEWKDDKRNGPGTYYFLADNQWKGDKYVGEYKDNKFSGQGTYYYLADNQSKGMKYIGEWLDDKRNGLGIFYKPDGGVSQSGIYKDGDFVTAQYVDPNSFTRIAKGNSALSVAEAQRLENERKAAQLEEERKRIEEEKRQIALERQRTESQKSQVQVAPDNRRRLALVIGNDNYNSMPRLNNAVNDAKSMTDALRQANFEVMSYNNLDKRRMQEALRSFTGKLGRDDVGLFYFSGHGIQADNRNFLIPVGESVKKSSDVPYDGIDVNWVMDNLKDARNAVNIVVLDACRSSLPDVRGGMSRGLTVTEAPQGSIVAYSTSPGKPAQDGDGSNSPFTKNLIRVMQRKGMKIEDAFKEVRQSVIRDSNGEQVPQEVSQLIGDFYFRP